MISAPIPPPSASHPLPAELDRIVLKALERDLNKRYQTAEDLQRDLGAALQSLQPNYQASDLSKSMRTWFASELAEDRKRLQENLALTPIDPHTGQATDDATKTLSLTQTQTLTNTVLEMEQTGTLQTPKMGVVPPIPDHSVTPPPIRVQNTKTFSMPQTGVYQSPGTRTHMIMRRMNALESEIGKTKDTSSNTTLWIGLGAILFLGVAGYMGHSYWKAATQLDKQTESKGESVMKHADWADMTAPTAPTANAENNNSSAPANPNAPTTARVKLDYGVAVIDVFLNKEKITLENGTFPAPVGKPIEILVKRPGYEDIRINTELANPATFNFPLNFIVERPKGYLNFVTTPGTQSKFYLGTEKVHEAVGSFHGTMLPVGVYKITLENPFSEQKAEAEVVIEEGKTSNLKKELSI